MKKLTTKNLSQSRLIEVLRYSPDSGVWTWRIGRPGASKGSVAGHIAQNGYRHIRIDRKSYLSSRLAFLYMSGYFPEQDVDHINRVRADDRWINLREAHRICNKRNCGKLKNNSSGVTGVQLYKKNNLWSARIMINYKSIHLGYYKQKKEAVSARWEAEKKHNWPNCCTTSTAYQYLTNNKVNI